MKWKEFKKDCKFLIHILLADRTFKWAAFNLSFSCLLWRLRGLQTCPYHGFYAQSYFTGYCKKCGEVPRLPPMDGVCILCGEEKTVLQRASPNHNDDDIWSLCWECNEYIDWGLELYWCQQADHMGFKGKMVKPFDEWLFEKHQVYPKHESLEYVLKKNPEKIEGDG